VTYDPEGKWECIGCGCRFTFDPAEVDATECGCNYFIGWKRRWEPREKEPTEDEGG
jgi:hypothetical protein